MQFEKRVRFQAVLSLHHVREEYLALLQTVSPKVYCQSVIYFHAMSISPLTVFLLRSSLMSITIQSIT